MKKGGLISLISRNKTPGSPEEGMPPGRPPGRPPGSVPLSRRLRASVGIWWGRWGLPCSPRPEHLVVAVGRPVRLPPPVTPGHPTQAEIDAGFGAVLAELTRTFEAVKGGVPGYEGTQLVPV